MDTKSQAPAIKALLDDVLAGIAASDQDVPGWHVSQQPIAAIEEDFVFLKASSKDGEDAPFILPEHTEASIAVIHGSVEIAGTTGTLEPGRFYRFRPNGTREVRAIVPGTIIVCTFFRRVGSNGTRPMAAG